MERSSLSEINALPAPDAAAKLGGIFERSPWIVESTWNQAPFASIEALHSALADTVESAPAAVQIALIRAHPDLVGRAAQAGTLTPESSAEQRFAGLGPDDLTPEDVVRFRECNEAYKERFGFPFVICARDNRKESILAGFKQRLPNDRDTERRTALREIARIAWHRLNDLIES